MFGGVNFSGCGDGTHLCWGSSYQGRVGNNTNASSVAYPTPVSVVTSAQSIRHGWAHSCALINSGRISCWGGNYNSVLGHGIPDWHPTGGTTQESTQNPDGTTTPVDVLGPASLSGIFPFTLVVTATGLDGSVTTGTVTFALASP